MTLSTLFNALFSLLVWMLLSTNNDLLFTCAQELQQLSQDQCSFCADGSIPASGNMSTSPFHISSDASLTCQDLPTNAITLLNFGLTNSDFQCEVSQLWAYEYCGCPTPPDVRPCWICRDGDENYDKYRWVPGSADSGSGVEGSCGFQAYFSGLRYDHFGRASDSIELKCPHMTWGMDAWCGCPAESATLPECTLCGNGKISPEPCRRNPLAAKMHASTGQPVGPSFGTCQYYDWIVERLQGPQCGIFEGDPSIQFDDLDVRSFCCDDNEPDASGVKLCGTSDLTLTDDTKAQSVIPPLGDTCFEVAQAARWLQTDTILTEPWSGVAGTISLRDFCCNSDTEWDSTTSSSSSESKTNLLCQAIPRAQYERSGATGLTPVSIDGLVSALVRTVMAWCWV